MRRSTNVGSAHTGSVARGAPMPRSAPSQAPCAPKARVAKRSAAAFSVATHPPLLRVWCPALAGPTSRTGTNSRTSAVEQDVRRPFDDDLPIEDGDAIGDAAHQFEIVRHHQTVVRPLRFALTRIDSKMRAADSSKPCRRFVEEQQLRLRIECVREQRRGEALRRRAPPAAAPPIPTDRPGRAAAPPRRARAASARGTPDGAAASARGSPRPSPAASDRPRTPAARSRRRQTRSSSSRSRRQMRSD